MYTAANGSAASETHAYDPAHKYPNHRRTGSLIEIELVCLSCTLDLRGIRVF